MTVTLPENTQRARCAIAEAVGRDLRDLADDQALTDLVAESFALVEAVIRIQEILDIRLVRDDLRDVSTVGELAAVVAARL